MDTDSMRRLGEKIRERYPHPPTMDLPPDLYAEYSVMDTLAGFIEELAEEATR